MVIVSFVRSSKAAFGAIFSVVLLKVFIVRSFNFSDIRVVECFLREGPTLVLPAGPSSLRRNPSQSLSNKQERDLSCQEAQHLRDNYRRSEQAEASRRQLINLSPGNSPMSSVSTTDVVSFQTGEKSILSISGNAGSGRPHTNMFLFGTRRS